MRRGSVRADEVWQALLRREEAAVEPVLTPERPEGFVYPFLEAQGLDPTDAGPLDELAKRGDLRRTVRYRLFLCPRDRGTHLRPARRCPSCGSEDVSRQPLVEHLSCGHIAPEEAFEAEDGLVCPKCGKRLKLVGKDYRRPADFHRCRHCGEITYVPDVDLHCPHCDAYFEVDAADERVLHRYERPPETSKRVDTVASAAADTLERAGYRVTLRGTRTGQSGVEHPADLYAAKEVSGLRTEVLLDVAVSSRPVSSHPLITLFGKAEDLGVGVVLFVAVPRLEDEARRYAAFHGIKVLEAGRDEVEDRLPDFLADELLLGRVAEEG